jgi:hypothetical protein
MLVIPNEVRNPRNQHSKRGHLTAFDVTLWIMPTFETATLLKSLY